jgi:Rps23 Pro-64 3,4-dihydroxylase Tpa1-like proline 4-hydroxylase
LDYVVAREADFVPGKVYNRLTGEGKVDPGRRDCMFLGDLGPFQTAVRSSVCNLAATALTELRINEAAVEPKEFDISAYGDGGHFNIHIDTLETIHRVRVLSCVYYFAAVPSRFTGGELRLYGLPAISAEGGAEPFVDITPETDTLVAFASWLRHEVRPVQVPSGAWADRRFAINCWVHRVQPTQ